MEIISQYTISDLSSDISINERNTPAIEMLGDNIDVSITPSKMTAESQR